MFFNSIEFIIFLPFVLVIFYCTSNKFRPLVLLLASYYFYLSWNPIYLILILFSTLTDYFAGISLSRFQDKLSRKFILFTSVFINLGLLVFFKYSNFILVNFNFFLEKVSETSQPIELLDLILPVGISFYTFQTLSYTIDVYRKNIPAERNLSIFALYVSFFPQLVAGPIERFSALAHQFKEKAVLNRENISHGVRLILYGLFMKMVIADNLSMIVDNSYSDIKNIQSLNLIIAAVFYSFQIYCDFHGYSTIAIGLAKLFNIQLSANFKTPYFSPSLTVFWRKWHITLTDFFRDYIYYPLGGNKQNKYKWILAILIVFIVSGIWHGANWTFVIWGLFHALFTILEKLFKVQKSSSSILINSFKIVFTFSIVTLLWVLFRSPDLAIAKEFYHSLFSNWNLEFKMIPFEPIILLLIFLIFEFISRKIDFANFVGRQTFIFRCILYFILIFLIMSRSGTETAPFIYFQF